MDDLTLRLPSELRDQLEAEAEKRGVPVGEHICEIIDAHCRGDARLDRPDIEIQYAHTVATSGPRTGRSGGGDEEPSTTEITSLSYGSRSILS
jgi:hypothetical protein